jgi:outer membrane murein-binding lipoprotein Lpp
MTIWIDIGIGILIGLLLGILIAGLVLQAIVNRRDKPVPELLKQRAALETQLHEARAETDQILSDNNQLRTDLTRLRETSEEHRMARVTLANEQTNLKMQLSTTQGMLASASTEKDRLLMDVIMLRTEIDSLRSKTETTEAIVTAEATEAAEATETSDVE